MLELPVGLRLELRVGLRVEVRVGYVLATFCRPAHVLRVERGLCTCWPTFWRVYAAISTF